MTDRLGIDLGGTKIEGIVLDPAGEISHRTRVDTPKNDYQGTIRAIGELAKRLDPAERLKVGVGTPGSWIPATGLMQNCNSTWLNGQPLLADLNQALGGRVRIANDADCFALSEAHGGSGEGKDVVFGVILGTGVGGGLVVEGGLLRGPNGLTGEWGHTPLYLPDELSAELRLPPRTCYCGRQDCVETYLSGPGLLATHRVLWPAEAEPPTTGEAVYQQSMLGAATGDWWREDGLPEQESRDDGPRRARRTLKVWSEMLAANLARIVNTLDPHVIVLGGGLSEMRELYPVVRELMAPHVFGEVFHTELLPPRFGGSSGVRGAAWLWGPEEG